MTVAVMEAPSADFAWPAWLQEVLDGAAMDLVEHELTAIDWYCGGGGSSTGLRAAGFKVITAANHWDVAIRTHSANHPDTEHFLGSIEDLDPRTWRGCDLFWASPECQESSQANGKKIVDNAQLTFDDPIPDEAGQRSRASARDVVRYVEHHRPKAFVIENVVRWANWEWFPEVVRRLRGAGYNVQILSVNSGHVRGPRLGTIGQSRDRIYIVGLRLDLIPKGKRAPDWSPRPPAVCREHGDIRSIQSWKKPNGRRIGRHGPRGQYTYVCPACGTSAEPGMPAGGLHVDWTDLGTPLNGRLGKNSRQRVHVGLRKHAGAIIAQVAGNTWERPGSSYTRAWPITDPLKARTGTGGDGLALAPAIFDFRRGAGVRPVDEPFTTISTIEHLALLGAPIVVPVGGSWNDTAYSPLAQPLRTRTTSESEGLAVPPALAVYLRGTSESHIASSARPLTDPLRTIAAEGRHHGLVALPGFAVKHYGGNTKPEQTYVPLTGPLSTITGADHHSLVCPHLDAEELARLIDEIDLDDVLFRMLKPREHLSAQGFPASYIVHGNQGEQTMQAGNAVSTNVAEWLTGQIRDVLLERYEWAVAA